MRLRRNTLAIDAGIAVLIAVLILVISPGLAITGLIALLALLGIGISFLIDSRRSRRRARTRTRPMTPRRRPAAPPPSRRR